MLRILLFLALTFMIIASIDASRGLPFSETSVEVCDHDTCPEYQGDLPEVLLTNALRLSPELFYTEYYRRNICEEAAALVSTYSLNSVEREITLLRELGIIDVLIDEELVYLKPGRHTDSFIWDGIYNGYNGRTGCYPTTFAWNVLFALFASVFLFVILRRLLRWMKQ